MDENKWIQYLITFNYGFNIFITKEFNIEIFNIINNIFPSLIITHKKIITNSITIILDIFAITSNFDFIKYNKSEYFNSIRKNNYFTIQNLVNLLLPNLRNTNKLATLENIYTEKEYSSVNFNFGEPEYMFSNVQYSRANRTTHMEVKYNLNFYVHNLLLIINTLFMVSNKLYVNWINIFPNKIDIENSDMFSDMFYMSIQKCVVNNSFKDVDITTLCDGENIKNLDHFYIGDIYNTLCHEFYMNIKDIKWLIYDMLVYSIDDDPRFLPILFILNKIINLNKCVLDIPFKYLSKEDVDLFEKSIKSFIRIAKGTENLYITSNKYIENSNVKKIAKYIVLFFDRKYSDKEKLQDYLVVENIKDASIDVIFDIFKTIPIELLYDFFRLSITQLLHSGFYSYYLIVNNKIVENFLEEKYIFDIPRNIDSYSVSIGHETRLITMATLKNIYNFGKSLCHYIKEDVYIEMPTLWESLSSKERQLIINRLNNDNNNLDKKRWFDISNNIRIVYKSLRIKLDDKVVHKINDIIYKLIRNSLGKIIYNSLVHNGFFSHIIPEQFTLKLDNYFAINFVSMNYYTKEYFDVIKQEDTKIWNKSKAYHWTNQLILFHHYANNRVIFITGGTGVGKSTQIPKLLLYALKIIDRKTTGRIVCSQPRHLPTESIASEILRQLGFQSVKHLDKMNNDENFYYIQYKHKTDSKGKGNYTKAVSYPYVLFTTDGILIKEAMNPMMKTKIDIKSKNVRLTGKNLFDIVIVDESHEHNKNMDMILTLIKNALYYNNDLKLVIMSATMEKDESTYRRFYRDINDNKKYPLNSFIKKYDIDRINVDRMFNISSELDFSVVEHYEREDIPSNKMANAIVNKTIEIINKNPTGDILIFRSGKAKINEVYQLLLNKTSSNVIILQYHRKLKESQKNIIERIKEKHEEKDGRIINYSISDIKVDKKEASTNLDYINGIGHYTRMILVSTNIAEASITIPTLKFVIDEGTQNIARYDPFQKIFTLSETNISDVNRIQRKGRVGRVSDGDAYFMYKKDKMKTNKQQYSITISDITSDIFSILTSNKEDILFSIDITKLDKKKLKENFKSTKTAKIRTMENFLVEMYGIKHGLESMIKKQYFIRNKYFGYEGNKNHYDYENNTIINTLFDGYLYEDVIDETGKFYIIHPNEDIIERNLFGTIVKANDIEINKIPLKKMNAYMKELIDIKLIQDKVKTDIGKFVLGIINNINNITLNIQFVNALMNAFKINKYELFSRFLSIYFTYEEFSLENFFNIKNTRNLEIFKNVFRLEDGSITAMLNIVNDLHNFLESKNINIETTKDITKKDLKIIKNINELITDVSFNIHSDEIKAHEKESLLKSDVFLEVKKNIMSEAILLWLKNKNNLVSSDFIERYYRNYIRFIMLKELITSGKIINNYEEILDKIPSSDSDDIIQLLANCYPSHIIKEISGTEFYINIINPSTKTLFTIDMADKFIMKHMYRQGYLLFISQDVDQNEVSLINYIPKQLVKKIYEKNKIKGSDFDKERNPKKSSELSIIGKIAITYDEIDTLFITQKRYRLTA
jgi:hypothetical protein